jgi:sugar lactone lactonase YvrE
MNGEASRREIMPMTATRRISLIASVLALLLAGQAFAQSIYWTETNFPAPKGGSAQPDGSGPATAALTPATLPEGVAFDLLNDKVYWVESGFVNARVLRAEADYSGISEMVTGGSTFRGLALDVPGNHMYWTSSNLIAGSKIHRADLDGNNQTVLIDFGPGNFNPRGIALDLMNGKMYWADFDTDQIRRADLDGMNVTDLIALAAGSGPWGVALDVDAGMLYWTEYNTGRVMRAASDGMGPTQLVTGLGNPTYITQDTEDDKLIWVEAGAGNQKIQRSDLNGGNVQDLGITISTYGGIDYAPNIATQTRLLVFVANPVGEGIELQWQFGEQDVYKDLWVERSELAYESWFSLGAEIQQQGESFVAFDGDVLPGRSYRYRLVAVTPKDMTVTFGPVIGTAKATITEFALAPIQPNPARGSAQVNFAVPTKSRVTISVIDVRGRVVASLLNEVKEPGRYEVAWDGKTDAGLSAPGTYFVQLRSAETQLVQRVVFMR